MAPNFLLKTRVPAGDLLVVGGAAVAEQYPRLRELLIERAGREVAALFAEPVVGRRDDDVEVAWYAETPGEPVAFAALDPTAQQKVRESLRSKLAALAPLLDNPTVGPLLRPALYLFGEDSLLAVGPEPVLVNWAALPGGRRASPDERRASFAATLGRFAPFPAPDLEPPGRVGPASPLSTLDAAPPARARRPVPNLGLSVATGAAAALALLLSLPGILQPLPSKASMSQSDLDVLRKVTQAMRDKNEETRRALDEGECGPDGELKPKGSQTLPPAPNPVNVPEAPKSSGMRLVAQRANESVVMVLACANRANWEAAQREQGEDPAKEPPSPCPKSILSGQSPAAPVFFLGLGSGFFVGPQTVVTNQHVIAHADVVAITNHFLGTVRPAKIVAATSKLRVDDPDFAVLRAEVENSPEPVPLATKTSRLEDVISVGFPGLFLEEEPAFLRLLQGDEQSVPDPVTYPGYVTLTVGEDGPLPLIYSSANIGHGNSGGPLLDLCGRAVGVNTWEAAGKDEEAGFKVNIAEGARGLKSFLDAHGVSASASDEACEGPQSAQNGQNGGAAPPSPAAPSTR